MPIGSEFQHAGGTFVRTGELPALCDCGRVFVDKGYNGVPIRQHADSRFRRSAEAAAAAEARVAKASLRAAELEAAWLAEGPRSVSVDFGSGVTEEFAFTSVMING